MCSMLLLKVEKQSSFEKKKYLWIYLYKCMYDDDHDDGIKKQY